MTTPRLVILDRDGVINVDSDDFIKSASEWEPIEGSLDAIAALTQHGFTVVVATNQSGIGRGLFDQGTLRAIHDKMCAAVRAAGGDIANIYVCPHAPNAGCDCRKPATGMFEQIQRDYQSTLENVPAIGDAARDLQAAASIGARPILVLTGKGELTQGNLDHPVETHPDLATAAVELCAEVDGE